MNIFKQKEIVGLDKGGLGNPRTGKSDAVLFPIVESPESKKPALAGFFIISQRPIRLQLRLLQTDL